MNPPVPETVDVAQDQRDLTLVELLRRRAEVSPEHVPHRFSDDGEAWTQELTYRTLDQRARAVAVLLTGHTRPGDRVLLLYPPGLDFTIAFWACLYAGLIAVPVAPPSLRRLESSLGRLAAIAGNSGARLLATTTAVREQLLPVGAHLAAFREVELLATDVAPAPAPTGWQPPPVSGSSIAYLQYSSGSTGLPKGVALPHSAVLANARVIGRAADLRAGDSGVSWLPTFHDMGLLAAVILPAVHDFTLHQFPPLTFVQRPLTWLRAISDTRAQLSVAPNFAYDLCVRRIRPEQAAELDLSGWRVALCGAEPIQARVLRTFSARFAVSGFRPETLFPCYGLAEATLLVTGGPARSGVISLRVDADQLTQGRVRPDPVGGRCELVASGEIQPDLPVVVADPDTLQPRAPGAVGELLVRGASVAAGYWDNPDATIGTFDVTVAGLGGGFLRTGDLGFVHAGQVYVTGRRKDLIILDGSNHYPHDIEAVVVATHPAVRPGGVAAFQVGVPGERPTLVVVAEIERGVTLTAQPPAPGRTVPVGPADGPADEPADEPAAIVAGELVASIRQAVHRGCAVPLDDVVLVRRGTIPLTTSGKLQRYAVAALYRDGCLDQNRVVPDQNGPVTVPAGRADRPGQPAPGPAR